MDILITAIIIVVFVIAPIMAAYEWVVANPGKVVIGLIVAISLFFLIEWLREKSRKKRNDTYLRSMTIDKIDMMSGEEFEETIAKLLAKQGFTDINVTPYSGDHGVDILATKDEVKYAVQCKRYNSYVGNKAIQEVFTGQHYYHAHSAIVVTNRWFTKNAQQEAKKLDVELWDRNTLSRMLESEIQKSLKAARSDSQEEDKQISSRLAMINSEIPKRMNGLLRMNLKTFHRKKLILI